jgi:hypothetical protein
MLPQLQNLTTLSEVSQIVGETQSSDFEIYPEMQVSIGMVAVEIAANETFLGSIFREAVIEIFDVSNDTFADENMGNETYGNETLGNETY